MNKETLFAYPVPNVGLTSRNERGITYRQYLAARVYPEMISKFYDPTDLQRKYARAAEFTWQAVDALIEAEEANNGKDNN